MGPLVPDIIGNDLNFIVAFFIGIGFGFILEQAGFSTSKKLVGLFYGYDFTVLRVFFTAGITAMFGVIVLGHFRLLDVSLIYINPTFLWSAIVGGLIMGLGFVVGGFCPGTSICGAAIGKIDAMLFVAGSFLGVLLFAEGYPLLEPLYKSANWGNVRIFDTLGMSQGIFAFLLIAMAVGSFWFVKFIENRVNGKGGTYQPDKINLGLSAIALLLGVTAIFLPDSREKILSAADEMQKKTGAINQISTDELAFRILDSDANLAIYDLRAAKEFDSLSLPNSTRIGMNNLFEKDARKSLSIKKRINVFVDDDETSARKAAAAAEMLGFNGVFVLKGGMRAFIKDYLKADSTSAQVNADTYRFRRYASVLLPRIIQENRAKHNGSQVKSAKRALGGC